MIVGAPVHVPTDAVTTKPTLGVPLIDGSALFVGALETIATVGPDSALTARADCRCSPSRGRARVFPMSVPTGAYVELFDPEMSLQPSPSELQRSHW